MFLCKAALALAPVVAPARYRPVLDAVREQGLLAQAPMRLLRELAWPVLRLLVIAICLPHVVARLLLPLPGLADDLALALADRHAHLAFLVLLGSFALVRLLSVALVALHDQVRSDLYLRARRVRNIDELPPRGADLAAAAH